MSLEHASTDLRGRTIEVQTKVDGIGPKLDGRWDYPTTPWLPTKSTNIHNVRDRVNHRGSARRAHLGALTPGAVHGRLHRHYLSVSYWYRPCG